MNRFIFKCNIFEGKKCQNKMLNEKQLHEYSVSAVSSQLREHVEPGQPRKTQRGSHSALCESVSVQKCKGQCGSGLLLRLRTVSMWTRCSERPEEARGCTMLLCSLCCTSVMLPFCLALSLLQRQTPLPLSQTHAYMHAH